MTVALVFGMTFLPNVTLPRERLGRCGARELSEQELLAIILGVGTRSADVLSVSRDLLLRFGSVAALAEADLAELGEVAGIGPARAAKIAAAIELGRRSLTSGLVRPILSCAADVHRLLRGRAPGGKEVFWALALDARHRLIRQIRVAEGSLSAVEVHPREVFRPLVRAGAAAAIVAHNHPSGDPTPSPEDIAITDRLVEGGELMGIPLLDHVVITSSGYESLAEANLV